MEVPSDSDTAATMGEEFRRLRASAGLTQSELGNAVGVAQPRISSIERDEAMPEFRHFPAYAQAFGITIATLTERFARHLQQTESRGDCPEPISTSI